MFDNILGWIVGIVATIIIIVLVVFIVKDIVAWLQGQGVSLLKILGKVGGVILIIAILFLAKNFSQNGQSIADGVGKDVVDQGIQEVNGALGGGGGAGGGGAKKP